MPGFQSFLRILHDFLFAKLTTSSIKVKLPYNRVFHIDIEQILVAKAPIASLLSSPGIEYLALWCGLCCVSD